MNRILRAWISPSSAHPLLKTGKNRSHPHSTNVYYSKVDGFVGRLLRWSGSTCSHQGVDRGE